MTVSITVTFASAEEAITALAKLRAPDTKDAATPAKPAKTEKAAAAPTPSTAPVPPAAAPATSDTAAADKAASDALYDKVKAAITLHTKDTANVPKVKGVLTAFNAKTGKDLRVGDYEKFLAMLEDTMKPAAEDLS